MKFSDDGSSICKTKKSSFQVNSDVSAFSALGLYVLHLAVKLADSATGGMADAENGTNRARVEPGMNEVLDPDRFRRPGL